MSCKLVLLRHGESQWNLENRFTGWTDVDLSANGLREALLAGRLLKEEGFDFDLAFTSVLKRAVRTLWAVLDEMDLVWIPVVHAWELNERHYGVLQGLDKAETAARFGNERVLAWRRAYAVAPDPLPAGDPREANGDPRYAALDPARIPRTECLKDTVERVVPFWSESIAPLVRQGKRVIVVAHGNSLRALVKHLDAISDDDIVGLNIPTARPMVYEFDDSLKPVRRYYLGDAEEIAAAAGAIVAQGLAR